MYFLYQKQDQEGPKVIPEETELNSSKTTVSAGSEEKVPSVPTVPAASTTPTATATVSSTQQQPNGNGKGVPEENPWWKPKVTGVDGAYEWYYYNKLNEIMRAANVLHSIRK